MAKILVVGDVMLDILIEGEPTRLAPDAPWAPVIRADAARLRLGGAGFVATVLRRLGHEVELVCALGHDWPRSVIFDLAGGLGLNIMALPADRTTLKISTVADDGYRYHQIARGDVDSTTVKVIPDWLDHEAKELKADALVCADYDKGMFRAAEFDSPNMVWAPLRIADPKPRNVVRFRGFDVLTPNDKEAWSILCESCPTTDTHLACQKLERLLGCRNVLITCNGQGVFSGDRTFISAAEWSGRAPRTLSGAGDVFTAVLASQLVAGQDLNTAATEAERASRRFSFTSELPGADDDCR